MDVVLLQILVLTTMKFKIGARIVAKCNIKQGGRYGSWAVRVVRGYQYGWYTCPLLVSGRQPRMREEYIDNAYVEVYSFNDYYNEV